MEASGRRAADDVLTESGFAVFYRRSLPAVYGYLLRLTGGDTAQAEELTQDTWCALVEELRAGRVERATVGWLVTVARSRFLDGYRRANRSARPLRVAWTNPEVVDPWEPARTDVIEHLGALAADHRVAMVLAYVDELPIDDIASLLARSVPATHSLLARARRDLRSRMEAP